MIEPPLITPAHLKIASFVRVGDYLMPTDEMIQVFKLQKPRLVVAAISKEPNGSTSGLAFAIQGMSGMFDASWFRWTSH